MALPLAKTRRRLSLSTVSLRPVEGLELLIETEILEPVLAFTDGVR